MTGRVVLFLVLVVMACLQAVPVVVGDMSGVCEPGEFVVNATGTFICLPARAELEMPFVGMRFEYNDTGVYVYVVSFVNDTSGKIQIWDPNLTLLYTIDITELDAGDIASYMIALQDYSYGYVVVNATINNYYLGMFAVPKTAESVVNLKKLYEINPKIALMVTVAIMAPFMGVVMRGKPREAGIGLIGLGLLYVPIMHVLGLPSPMPEFLATFAVITGLVLIAANAKG